MCDLCAPQNTNIGDMVWLFCVLLLLTMLGRAAFVFPFAFLHNACSRERLSFKEMIVIWCAAHLSHALHSHLTGAVTLVIDATAARQSAECQRAACDYIHTQLHTVSASHLLHELLGHSVRGQHKFMLVDHCKWHLWHACMCACGWIVSQRMHACMYTCMWADATSICHIS
jgi:hypothetical protein